MPAGYLAKVLQSLARAELVHSQRGLHGGFTLTRTPKRITVWEVIDAVDPIQRIRSCPLGLKAHGVHLCAMHRRLDDAMASVERAFRGSTVAELLADPNPSKPLCEFPRVPPKNASQRDGFGTAWPNLPRPSRVLFVRGLPSAAGKRV